MAPPTALLEPVAEGELAPADTLIGMGVTEHTRVSGRSRRWLVISASAAIALLVAFGVREFAAIDGEAKPSAAPRIVPATDPRAITAALPPVDPHPTAKVPDQIAAKVPDEPDEIEMTPDDPPPVRYAVAKLTSRVPRETPHKPIRKDPKLPGAPSPALFTHDQLVQKFQQVRREYVDYRAKFGERLEKEWGELATYIQYIPDSDDAGRKEAASRLDAFSARMRK